MFQTVYNHRFVLAVQKCAVILLVFQLVCSDLSLLLQWPPAIPEVPAAEAADDNSIFIETFNQNVTTDGATFTLQNDVGDVNAAFIRLNSGVRKTSAGPTGVTTDTAPNVGTVGLRLTDTDEITVERASSTEVKVIGEVWRYEGPSGGIHEFIVRDRVAITLSGSLASQPISGIANIDNVIPFITGYTVDESNVNNWEYANIAAHMNDGGDLVVSRNNSGTTATVYVDVVEFTGSAWTVCHGYSGNHDTAPEVVTLNTDSDGQGGSTCDVGDWSTATIIEATMEGDSTEGNLDDVLALVRPRATTTEVEFDVQIETSAENDGEAWIHVLQNDALVVHRATSLDPNEQDGDYASLPWPLGAPAPTSIDLVGLEFYTDSSGTGAAHMRGGLNAGIATTSFTTYSDGATFSPGTEFGNRDQLAYFEADVTFAALPEGVIFEAGGGGVGALVGYNDTTGDFVIRAGSGSNGSPSNAARVAISPSEYDFSSRSGVLYFTFDPIQDSVTLSFDESTDGSIDYSTTTTAASDFSQWTGTGGGAIGDINGSEPGGEISSVSNFNGTISEVRYAANATEGGFQIRHWVHRTGNNIEVEYGIIDVSGLTFDPVFLGFDTLVTATSTHIATATIPSSDVYVGGAFSIREKSATRNVTNITITESGTVNAAVGLDDIELWYDLSTTSPFDCSEHSYNGNEAQFGDTDDTGFSGADGSSSFTDAVQISPSQTMCIYPVLSVTNEASNGETIEISIDDASTDVTVTGSALVGSASYPQSIGGSTTLQNAELTQTGYRWLEDDGGEGAATAVAAENTSAIGFSAGNNRRVRVQVDNAGSITSPSVQYRLEYATSTGVCSATTGWEDVGATGGAWDMGASVIVDGNNATNIALGSGGVSDPAGQSFATVNTGLRDTNSQTNGVTLASNEFTEFEFSIQPTINAVEGTTYCFRLSDAGSPLKNYDIYPEGTVSADITVSASGTQATSLDAGATDQHVGGTFVVARDSTNRTLTDITISETGSVDATLLSNPRLYYDLDISAPHDCSSESYSGFETSVNGSAFSGVDGSTTFSSLGILLNSTTTLCGYLVVDLDSSINNGETIDIEITDPSTEVVVTSSSVGPSSPVAPTGSTTVAGPILTQTGYHWRTDNGTETTASSTTGGLENTPIIDVGQNDPVRLRYQVNNAGSVASDATSFTLEYATRIGGSCELASGWQGVDAGSAFVMASTSNLVDGNDTTNIATTTGGVSDPSGQTFQGSNAGQAENDDTAGPVTLSATQFTELEYALFATDQSGFETTYCFRVTDNGTELPAYDVYAELTTRQKQDFLIQRGTEVVSGTSLTLTAGVDYTAPAATSSAFVRITNHPMTGAGDDSGTNGQNADDVTAYISDQSDITSSFTIGRAATAGSNTEVSWEIIEYIGLPGADNEMIVRGVGEVAFASSELTDTGAVTDAVTDDDDVVVFITGQQNDDASTNNYNDALFIAAWSSSTSQAEFERGEADVSANLSYAVVEFTGLNWQIQRVENVYESAGVPELVSIDTVASLNRAFLHAQKLAGIGQDSIEEGGHLVYFSSIGGITFELRAGVTTPANHVSVAWVISNNQTGDGAMTVYRAAGDFPDPDPEPARYSVPIGGTVVPANASIFGVNTTAGTGNTYPRLQTGFTIASSTHFEVFRSDTANDMEYRVEVVEWPVAQLAFEQNYYRFYVDNNTLTPTDAWPAGAEDLGENTSITSLNEPLGEGERVRIRMTLQVNNASLPEATETFKLQYGRRVSSCSAITTWTDIGAPGSGSIWRGVNATPADGATLPATLISVADVAATYEEENATAVNPAFADLDEDIEFDWLIEHNGAVQQSDYCFRMVAADDSLLAAYNQYPTLRTTGYTPVSNDWRWYADEENLTPTTALAATNSAPINIVNEEPMKLRVVASEVEGATGNNVKFRLQFSQSPTFSDGGTFVVASSSCTATSTWCYADGAGADNATITTAVLATADSCVAGVGDGCGTYNEFPTSTSALTQAANSSMEFEFTIRSAAPRVSAVYYFRLYNVPADQPVLASTTYPSVQTEGGAVTFTVSSIAAGTSTEGVVTDVATTPVSIPFGTVPFDVEYEAAYRLFVDTNATQGHRILMYATGDMVNQYGTRVEPIVGTNESPVGWSVGCGSAISCIGYHVGDDILSGGSTRFSPNDTYAAFSSTTPEEVMFSSQPTVNEFTDIIVKLQVSNAQAAGQYEKDIVFISVPIF